MQFFKSFKSIFLVRQGLRLNFAKYRESYQAGDKQERQERQERRAPSSKFLEETEVFNQWKDRLQSQKFMEESVGQQIQALQNQIFQKLDENSFNRSVARDKLLMKAIVEANLPQDAASEYLDDLKLRYQKQTTNEIPLTIVQYILRNKMLTEEKRQDIKDFLRKSENFKKTIDKIIIKSDRLQVFVNVLKTLVLLEYEDPQLNLAIQEEMFSKRKQFNVIQSDNNIAASKEVLKTMMNLKVVSDHFQQEKETSRFTTYPPLINTIIFECSLEMLKNCIKYAGQLRPDNILIITSMFFRSNICSPQSEHLQKLIHLVDLMAVRFESVKMLYVLNFLTKVGCDRELPLAKKLETLLIEKYEREKGFYNTTNVLNALRSGIYFNQSKYINLLLSQKDIIQDLTAYPNQANLADEFLTLYYQTMFKIPYFTKVDLKVDFKNFNNQLFKSQQSSGKPKVEVEDICNYFNSMGIHYTREFIIGGYSVDIYVPNMPKTLVTKDSDPTQCEQRFDSQQAQEKYYKKTQNPNSLFIELDGQNHFFDTEQTVYTGSCIMKRFFLRDHMKLKVSILKDKDIKKWNEIEESEKSKALLHLIHQNI